MTSQAFDQLCESLPPARPPMTVDEALDYVTGGRVPVRHVSDTPAPTARPAGAAPIREHTATVASADAVLEAWRQKVAESDGNRLIRAGEGLARLQEMLRK